MFDRTFVGRNRLRKYKWGLFGCMQMTMKLFYGSMGTYTSYLCSQPYMFPFFGAKSNKEYSTVSIDRNVHTRRKICTRSAVRE